MGRNPAICGPEPAEYAANGTFPYWWPFVWFAPTPAALLLIGVMLGNSPRFILRDFHVAYRARTEFRRRWTRNGTNAGTWPSRAGPVLWNQAIVADRDNLSALQALTRRLDLNWPFLSLFSFGHRRRPQVAPRVVRFEH